MNKDCEIVKDLLPNYLGKILSKESEVFINSHINECNECKLILKNMKNGKKYNIKDEEKHEINHLKKYKSRLTALKLILVLFIVSVFIGAFIIMFKYNYKLKLMDKVGEKIESLRQSDNYNIEITTHNIDYERNTDYTFCSSYYYKDGKYKTYTKTESLTDIISSATDIYYGEINSNKQSLVLEDKKTIINSISKYNNIKKGDFIDYIDSNGIDMFTKKFGLYHNIGYKIKEDRYNGKECYIFRIDNNSGYTEYWIEKESMLPIRLIEDYYNRFYTELTYSIIEGTVQDSDVIIPSLEGYEIKESIIN